MLKLRQIASNMTEVEIDNVTVLFSYKTPVACHVEGEGYYRTACRWSQTTTRHINKWLANMRPVDAVKEREQSYFDNLIA
jgi:hypothetical protein